MKTIVLIAALLLAAAAAKASVVFYTSFDNTVTPVTAKDPAFEVKEGTPTYQEGKRGEAMLVGDGQPFIEYKAVNVPGKEGTMEFWFKPLDWNGVDTDTFHVFVETDTDKVGNWFLVYKYYAAQNAGFIWEKDGSIFQRKMSGWQGWVHMLVTWSPKGCRMYFNGQPSALTLPKDPPTQYTGKMTVGDRAWTIKREKEHTLIDELYIYDRAMEPEEAAWALANAETRVQGSDIPAGLVPMKVRAKILPSQHTIIAEVQPRDQAYLKNLTGYAELLGPTPIPKQTMNNAIHYTKLAPGDYALRAWFEDKDGKVIDEATDNFTVPTNDWLGNKIGISSKPPKPFTPIKATKNGFSCWGRSYKFAPSGLPLSVKSLGKEMLAGPVTLKAYYGGKPIAWKTEPLKLHNPTAVDAVFYVAGQPHLLARTEYDGMIRYDLSVDPKHYTPIDKLELRFPIRGDQATLMNCQLADGMKVGAVPGGDGVVVKSTGFSYWWLGNEDRGLLAFCESDEAWDRLDRPDAFRIERRRSSSGVETVEVVLSFIDGRKTLTKPWRFTFGFQATPVKDISRLRGKPSRVLPMNEWLLPGTRDYTPNGLAAQIENEGIRPEGQKGFLVFWDGGEWKTYDPTYGKPDVYKEGLARLKAKGLMPLAYMMPREIPESVPEWRFWEAEWAANRKTAWTDEQWDSTTCTPSWTDFLLDFRMKNLEKYGLAGYYTDNAQPANCRNLDGGTGYMRDGKLIGTTPWFGLREFYKRLYTALKSRPEPTMIMAHISTSWPIAYMGFIDNRLDGEQFRHPIINEHKSYTDIIPLDQWRAEYLSGSVGNMSVFLPEYGADDLKTPARTRELLSLLMLHDMIGTWFSVNGQFLTEPVNKLYQIQDDFNIQTADLIPYWSNTRLIQGQTDALKVTAYRHKDLGTALLVISNLGKEEQTARLKIDWKKLTGVIPHLFDAETGQPIPMDGANLTLPVGGRDYLLVGVNCLQGMHGEGAAL